jgi:hypothetical protein
VDPEWANVAAFAGTAVGTMILARIVDKVRGLDGPHDIADPDYRDEVDPKLLEKLEQWELFWRQGCYSGSDCAHAEKFERRMRNSQEQLKEAVEKSRQRKIYDYSGAVMSLEHYTRRMEEDRKRFYPECKKLDEEFSKVYRFDALEAHTKQINEMIERNKTWTLG